MDVNENERHLDTKESKETALLLLFYVSVNVESSIMSRTSTLKWVWAV